MDPLQFIDEYFRAEQVEALIFVLIGAVAIVAALMLWRRRSRLRGMAIPLVAVALIQLVVGGTVFLRSDAQIAQLRQQAQQTPTQFRHDETVRMKTVIANFEIYRGIEIGLLALGMALVVLGRNREFVFALGLGLALQSGLMLALDRSAEARARHYLLEVRAF